jgi:hypothetical protein
MSPAPRVQTIGWSDRGARLRWTKRRIDDWGKVSWFDAGESPRRSTSSLEADFAALRFPLSALGDDRGLPYCALWSRHLGSSVVSSLGSGRWRESFRVRDFVLYDHPPVRDPPGYAGTSLIGKDQTLSLVDRNSYGRSGRGSGFCSTSPTATAIRPGRSRVVSSFLRGLESRPGAH